jgi:hypothetical protein
MGEAYLPTWPIERVVIGAVWHWLQCNGPMALAKKFLVLWTQPLSFDSSWRTLLYPLDVGVLCLSHWMAIGKETGSKFPINVSGMKGVRSSSPREIHLASNRTVQGNSNGTISERDVESVGVLGKKGDKRKYMNTLLPDAQADSRQRKIGPGESCGV